MIRCPLCHWWSCRDASLTACGAAYRLIRIFLLIFDNIHFIALMFQFWACCGCSLALMNTVCAGLSLPSLVTPLSLIYLMCVAVPMLATTLVRTDANQQVMNRSTGKKQTTFDSNVFFFVLWCYGCKFLPTTLIMVSFPIYNFTKSLQMLSFTDSVILHIYVTPNRCFGERNSRF